MSYLHCPVCSRAFNVAQHPTCPSCPVPARPVDPVDDLVAAAEALSRALAHATPAQRAAVAAHIHLPEPLPAPRAVAVTDALPAIRGALTAAPQRAGRTSRWLAALAVAALDRVAPHAAAALDRVAPHAPKRLLRAVHAGVKAFAA